MNLKKNIKFLPGIILAYIFYLFSIIINNIIGTELLGLEKSPISTVMIAILLGIIMGNAFTPRPGMIMGLDFTQKYILKLGIIFLGIRLSFAEFIKFGTIAIPLIIICIISVLVLIKLLIRKFPISSKMSYLIAIGTSVCGATAIVATAPVINAKKSEVAYAIANITLFGILAMLVYPYFSNFYFEENAIQAGLFLGTAIHETSQVAAAGLIYDQQFNSPETLNVATVTKLIRNTFLVIMIPLFAFLYNRGEIKKNDYSILNIFPYFVLGFIGMIIFRNIGDQIFINGENINYEIWQSFIIIIKNLATVFLTMAMAAIGLSINLNELRSMGYKPFIVGFVSAVTVGLISILTMQLFDKIINLII
ncbi:MAG: putative sulfate exporter family transporter [Candidatus Pelagibacter sp.]|nr:putative sulfate exporter family transporter [Candidatus Pelagibacter sp.]|tara:strand:- start:1079 stop:2170 length:1092 start_codon:yes stop_codon:yes gene_type:complete